MEEVQKYDCICNKYSKSYKEKCIKMNCWTKIGEKLNWLSAADAEKKWKRQDWLREVSEDWVKSIPTRSAAGCGILLPYPKTLLALTGFNNII